MDISRIRAVDPLDMWGHTCSFPDQWRQALARSADLEFSFDKKRIRNVCITGMGGSAIPGDLLRGYMAGTSRIPVVVSRQYTLPAWVDENTLFVACSYSGNTEETLNAFDRAMAIGAPTVCLTTGGSLMGKAVGSNCDFIHVEAGFESRAALAYFFVPMYRMFREMDMISDSPHSIESIPDFLEEQVGLFSDLENSRPLQIAEEIIDTLPVIYSNSEYLEAVNYRWRSQFAENAKVLSYGNVLPEMNHNEIVGWEQMAHLTGRLSAFMLYDAYEYSGTESRMEITRNLIRDHVVSMNMIPAEGPDRLSKMFYLIQFGDFLSLFYAYLNGTDPTPVAKIDMLKSMLG